jgi:hypothetical protein
MKRPRSLRTRFQTSERGLLAQLVLPRRLLVFPITFARSVAGYLSPYPSLSRGCPGLGEALSGRP